LFLDLPRELNCPANRFRADFLIALESFDDWDEISLKYITKAVFLLYGEKAKHTVATLKLLFVVIVSHGDFTYLLLDFG